MEEISDKKKIELDGKAQSAYEQNQPMGREHVLSKDCWCKPSVTSYCGKNELFEQLATIEHERWSDWMKYMFSRCIENTDGSLNIINTDVLHWKRQMSTHYDHLSEKEKQSDREQVGRYFHLIQKDDYHTMDELYEHRYALFIALCRQRTRFLKQDYQCWRSKLHSDNSYFDGWFILGIREIKGEQITYHLPINRWDETDFARTLEKAPEWDGHTSDDVLKRLKEL